MVVLKINCQSVEKWIKAPQQNNVTTKKKAKMMALLAPAALVTREDIFSTKWSLENFSLASMYLIKYIVMEVFGDFVLLASPASEWVDFGFFDSGAQRCCNSNEI